MCTVSWSQEAARKHRAELDAANKAAIARKAARAEAEAAADAAVIVHMVEKASAERCVAIARVHNCPCACMLVGPHSQVARR